MKAYQSCLQELNTPFIGVLPAGCDFDTDTIRSHSSSTASCKSSRRKKIRSSSVSAAPAHYFVASAFTGIIHVSGSVSAAPSFPVFPSYHFFKQKLLNPRRRKHCSFCSSNDAEYLEEGSDCGHSEQPGPELLTDRDSNAGEDMEYYGDANSDSDSDLELLSQDQNEEDGIGIQVTKLGKRSRRIESRIRINADLSTIWNVLTDYERLADFIPGLAVSRLLERGDNYARLFQIGQQNLALGVKFNAKAVLDCYEKDLEMLTLGQRRDIEFKMVEGDFVTFEGKWSIEQVREKHDAESCEALDLMEGQNFHTSLSYVVEVEPKLWLPVRLVEGRLCNEIKTNLSCIRQEAQMRTPSCF